MNEVQITYQTLFGLLLRLGFEDVSTVTPSRRVFRHQSTDTLLAFAEQPSGKHVREADFEQQVEASVDAQT